MWSKFEQFRSNINLVLWAIHETIVKNIYCHKYDLVINHIIIKLDELKILFEYHAERVGLKLSRLKTHLFSTTTHWGV